MIRTMFRSVLGVTLGVLLSGLLAYAVFLYGYFVKIEESHLSDQLAVVSVGVEREGETYLSMINAEDLRFTWIAADGRVIYDSSRLASSMPNHSDREEVREALVGGRGSSERYSSTLAEKTVYEAARLTDGSILRISTSRDTVISLLIGMLKPTVIVALFAAGLSILLARRVSRNVVRPINNLNLDEPLENEVYPELSPLLVRMESQRRTIDAQVSEIRRRVEEFEQITRNMREGLILLDCDHRIVGMNASAAKIFSIPGDVQGEDFLTLERDPDVRSAIYAAGNTGHAQLFHNRSGREYTIEISRIDSSGENLGIVILAFDRSERALAERARREFTANVSHELKTPLQSILGSAELIENGMIPEAEIPRFVKKISSEASRMAVLVDDILRLSYIDEAGVLPREEIAVVPMITQIFDSLRDKAARCDIELSCVGDARIIGVRSMIHEVFFNLVDNAVTYGREGGTVRVSISEVPGRVRILVEDDGVGIPSEDQDRIFERFYRVDKSRSKSSGGTGLGLSIVKRAVVYHEGSVAVESNIGKGTRMIVDLPASPEEF